MATQTIEPGFKTSVEQFLKPLKEATAVVWLKKQWQRLNDWIGQRTVRLVGAAFLTIAIIIGTGGYINQHSIFLLQGQPIRIYQDSPFLADFYANLSSELASIAITILIIDALNKRLQDEQLKAQLIRQMSSKHPDVAVTAVNELRAHGKNPDDDNWLSDGSLRWANLAGANLQEADLSWEANLQDANLREANLSRAFLRGANLQGAHLSDANLKGADLWQANLQGADLWQANLQDAYLSGANLQGADVRRANLQGVDLEEIYLKGADLSGANLKGVKNWQAEQLRQAKLEGTIMPDGTKLKDTRVMIIKVLARTMRPYLKGPTLEEWLLSQTQAESELLREPIRITSQDTSWLGAKVW